LRRVRPGFPQLPAQQHAKGFFFEEHFSHSAPEY
jgi:hypothetical protein